MKNIYEFKKGDIITKISPVEDPETGKKDYSLVGKKIEFKGIANASIYLKRPVEGFVSLFLGTESFIIQLPLEIWENGWDFYNEPEFLSDEIGNKSTNPSKEMELEDEIAKALKNEDFEKAAELREKLKKLRDPK